MGGTVAFIYGMALFGSTYLVPVFMQEALHLPPSQAGAVLLPAGLVLAVTIPIAGRFADRIAVSRMVSAGLVLLAASFFLMLGVGTATSLALITLWAVVGRLGLGMIMPSLNLGSMQGVRERADRAGLEHDQLPAPARRRGRHRPGRQRPRMALARARRRAARRLPRNLRAGRRDHRLRDRRRLAHGAAAGDRAASRTRSPALMNLDLDLLPERCDAIVVGAGPAGAAAAQWLARAGRSVVLVDAQAFPRDKVCGDGLIPDAHRALDRLGVLAQVMAEARASTTLACIAPRGGRIDVPGRLAVLPRKRLDEIICAAAVAAGARMFAPVRFVAPLRDGAGRVVGARLQHGERGARGAARPGSCWPAARSRRRRSPRASATGARRAASPCAATSRTRR